MNIGSGRPVSSRRWLPFGCISVLDKSVAPEVR
jgi:hypothetical protein